MESNEEKKEALTEANLKIGSVYILIASSICILISLYINRGKIIKGEENDLMTAEINKFDYAAITGRILPKAILLYYAWKHYKPIMENPELLKTKQNRGLRNAFVANLLDSSSSGLDIYSLFEKDVTFY